MAGKVIGFYKAVQGAFTAPRIESIKQRLEDFGHTVVEADFREGTLINGKVYVGGVCLNDCDIYFWHDTLRPADTGSDSYYIHLLNAFDADVKVINTGGSTAITNDKFRAHQRLKERGLPLPRYALVYSENRTGIEQAFSQLGEDVLVKPRFGGWGIGIVRCRSLEELQSVIELAVAVSTKKQQFLLEQFCKNDPNSQLSVAMIGQEPIIGYRKPANLGGAGWKVYDPEKKDGKGLFSEYVKPSQEVAELARRAQAAIGKDIIGFDFILTSEGYRIVDENGRPGLYEHCLAAAGVDISVTISDYIVSKLS